MYRFMHLDDVVNCECWITDPRDFVAFNKIYETYFTKDPPVRSIFPMRAFRTASGCFTLPLRCAGLGLRGSINGSRSMPARATRRAWARSLVRAGSRPRTTPPPRPYHRAGPSLTPPA